MSDQQLADFNSGLQSVIDAYKEKCGSMNVRVPPRACCSSAAVLQLCMCSCAGSGELLMGSQGTADGALLMVHC